LIIVKVDINRLMRIILIIVHMCYDLFGLLILLNRQEVLLNRHKVSY